MKRFRIFAILLTVVAASSCIFEEKEYFDESSAQRVQTSMKECNEVLTSAANGWVMEYYPDPSLTYGGYNVYLKFSQDGVVTAMSELTADPEASAESYYTMKQSAGAILSFDTYNDIFHMFSDPVGPAGATGDGMLGDYDFLVISADAEEVVLKGKKSGNYAYLHQLEGSWTDYRSKIEDLEEVVSGTFQIDIEGNKVDVSGSYRNYVLSYTDEDGEAVQEYIPYIVTPESVVLYEPLTLFGQEFTTVMPISGSDDLATDNAAVSFKAVVVPLGEQLAKGAWCVQYSNLSDWAKSQFDVADAATLASEGETVSYMFLCPGSFISSSYSSGWGLTFITDAGYAGQLGLSVATAEDGTATITYVAAKNQGDGNYYYNNCKFASYLNVIAKTFELRTDSMKNPSYILMTEKGNPDNWIKVTNTQDSYK